MNKFCFKYSLGLLFILIELATCDLSVELSSDGPVVLGSTIHFNAHVFNSDGSIPSGKFQYTWTDNAIQRHTAKMTLNSPVCAWNITYNATNYAPGPYIVEVDVDHGWFYYTSQRIEFNVTGLLNGNLQLTQYNQTQAGHFIASKKNVMHEIVLNQPDFDFVNGSATNITTYWFIDCQPVANTTGFKLVHNYSKSEQSHEIEAVVVVDFTPLPPPPTPTPPPNTTTTTSKPTTTTPKQITTKKPASVVKRSIFGFGSGAGNDLPMANFHKNILTPFTCKNKTLIIPEKNKTYGYFLRNITVKDPIENITISGNNWLQHGDLLKLSVSCNGSSPISYCLNFENGLKNVTGNETCKDIPVPLETCQFNIYRYFRDEDQHTIIIIMSNDVTKVIKPVVVTIYKAIHQPQLSVIVVPVAFSLVAVVLIVFGIAYFIQTRHRFIVEVADFDFGQQYAEMEYKTFYQRLRESMLDTFIGSFFVRNDDVIDESVNKQSTSTANRQPSPEMSGRNGFKYGSLP